MNEWDGPDRRNDDISIRVRDLEESDRAGAKSRQAMHKQLSNLSIKVDLVLSRMDDKAVDCAEHKTKLALLEQGHNILTDTIAKLADDQKWATRAAATGLIATTTGLVTYIWKVTVGR